jgi:hypothetical protein
MYVLVWVDEIAVEYLMKPKQDLRTKNLGKKNKFLLNQLKHSLKSPERFQQYLDRVASWPSRETGLQEVKDAFKVFHSSFRSQASQIMWQRIFSLFFTGKQPSRILRERREKYFRIQPKY